RLFQEAREKRGLCYAIYSSAWGLRDIGVFAIHAATGQEVFSELADVVVKQIRNCASGGLTEQEVSRAKAQLRAGLLMSMESSSGSLPLAKYLMIAI
ncbi:MAG: insulinase family protein, partial [Bacteroidota bacterium]